MRRAIFALAALAVAVPSFALTETFPDPLGGFYSRWLGANSNLTSYYYAAGDPDVNNRGNNPEGVWASDDPFNSLNAGPTMDLVFNPAFGATLTFLKFGGEYFAQCQVTIYDMSNNVLATNSFSGGDFGFDHADIISANSANGISHVFFDSSQFGGTQIEGNTSLDNFEATQGVPEPATMAVLGLGAAALLRRRRK